MLSTLESTNTEIHFSHITRWGSFRFFWKHFKSPPETHTTLSQCTDGDCVEINDMKCNRTCDSAKFDTSAVNYILLEVNITISTSVNMINIIQTMAITKKMITILRASEWCWQTARRRWSTALWCFPRPLSPTPSMLIHDFPDHDLLGDDHYDLVDDGHITHLPSAWTRWWPPAQTSRSTRRWTLSRWSCLCKAISDLKSKKITPSPHWSRVNCAKTFSFVNDSHWQLQASDCVNGTWIESLGVTDYNDITKKYSLHRFILTIWRDIIQGRRRGGVVLIHTATVHPRKEKIDGTLFLN